MDKILMLRVALATRFKSDKGAGLAEYALILFLISIIAAATLGPLGTTIAQVFTDTTGDITNPPPAP